MLAIIAAVAVQGLNRQSCKSNSQVHTNNLSHKQWLYCDYMTVDAM